MTAAPKTWFITGASKGIGQTLARQLLARGDRVAATSRTLHSLEAALGPASSRLLLLEVDLTNAKSIQSAVDQTITAFGHLNVVVNNAGYGQQGTIEALSDSELRNNFEVNFFAPFNVVHYVLPHLRRQRAGHIINVASIVGFQGGFAGWGSYVASKFALAGMTESLAAEVAELGIKATILYPGPVRTDFLSSGSLVVSQHQIDDYKEAQASLDLHLGTYAGNQSGDPERLASLIMQAADSVVPPLHLFAGFIANELAQQKMLAIGDEMKIWKGSSEATDFPS
ncbi:SDR family oxidoreductase [uncultured Caballeronia sp.]|uniref:SDR family oxidoreductase n=1 Tax=uncultured Caballeronia sp. TaxID=1827198 RepID=UPI0035CBC59B